MYLQYIMLLHAFSTNLHLMATIVLLVTVIISLTTATTSIGDFVNIRAFETTSANESFYSYLILFQVFFTMTGPLFYGSLTKKLYFIWRQVINKERVKDVTDFSDNTLKEVNDTWNVTDTDDLKLSISDIQLLFHQVELFPTESQIYEMIQCAARCSRHSNGNVGHDGPICPKIDPNRNFLSFGEFCFFVGDLMNSYRQRHRSSKSFSLSKSFLRKLSLAREFPESFEDFCEDDVSNCEFDVFLGGSCNPTNWRFEIVIPELKTNGITYYNPQVDHWGPELIELENYAKQNSEILFFVIDNQTRAIASMIEVAFICSTDRKLVLVINQLEPDSKISGESFLKEEYECLLKARTYLSDIVQRSDIPVFTQIDSAIQSTVRMIKSDLRPQDLSHQIDKVMPVRMGHISVADKMINISKIFETLKNSSNEFTFSELKLAYRSLTRKDLSDNMILEMARRHLMENKEIDQHSNLSNSKDFLPPLDRIKINFDQFCAIVTELHEEQLQKSLHNQKTKIYSIDKKSLIVVWLYFLKNLPISFFRSINRWFNIILGLGDDKLSETDRLSSNGKYMVPELQNIHENQFNPTVVSFVNESAMPMCTTRDQNIAHKSSHSNLSSHLKYVPLHQSYRYSNVALGSSNSASNPMTAKVDRIRRHSVSQSRFSPSPSPPPQSYPSRHYQPYKGASRHHLYHQMHSFHTTDSNSSISSLMYNSKYTDLFIGGDVELNLLEKTIIPELKKHSITYSTPMLHRWTSQRMIPLQAKNIEKNRVLLFIITKDSLDIASMILCAYYVGCGYKVVLCIQDIDSTSALWNKLSSNAIKDYNRGRAYLSDMATKAGVPVFSDILEAIHRAIEICD